MCILNIRMNRSIIQLLRLSVIVCITVIFMRTPKVFTSPVAAGLIAFDDEIHSSIYDFGNTRSVMKERLLNTIRTWVPLCRRYEIGRIVARLKEQLARMCLWKWGIARFNLYPGSQYNITYIGRKSRQNFAQAHLCSNQDLDTSPTRGNRSSRRVIISEMQFPGAICVPLSLSSVVPLGRPIEEITSSYHSQLRRSLQKDRKRYRLQQVISSAEIEYVDREMLRPYARARHGDSASQLGRDEIKRMAQGYGRLDLLLQDDEVVGCQLGHPVTRAGKRYWTTSRCGYPEAVFSDPKRMRDANSFNIYLALEWAIENGFDYYDIGISLGRPGDGLLEWKRRRGGELDTMGNTGYFHVRLPKVGAAQFLWESPLFAVEHRKMTLHLGLPEGPSEAEVMGRYREMGFGGLFKVYLHCARPPTEHVIKMLHSLYSHQKSPPVFKIVPST